MSMDNFNLNLIWKRYDNGDMFFIACSCRVCTQNYCKLTNYSKSLQNGLLINKPILLIEIENCPGFYFRLAFKVTAYSSNKQKYHKNCNKLNSLLYMILIRQIDFV